MTIANLVRSWFCAGALFALAHSARAAAGDLDLSFHGTGIVTTFFAGNTTSEEARAVAVQSDSKIVVVGRADQAFALVRLNTNGVLDATFGSGGKLTTSFAGAGDAANAVAIQTDGKIVVAGAATINGNNNFAVARYTTNGALDTTFGNQGKATFGFGVSSFRDYANAIAIQADGKIALAGALYSSSVDFCVARLNTNGTLDASFGNGGSVKTDLSNGLYDEAYALAIQPDGRIVVVGESASGGHTLMGVARYTTNGVLDTSFGTNGFTWIGYLNHSLLGQAVAIQPDGRILVGGRTLTTDTQGITGSFVLARLTANGLPDSTFGFGNGVVAQSIVGSSNNAAYGLLLQPDGKIVMCGSSDSASHGTNDFVLWRFNSDGTTDKITRYYSVNLNVNEEAKAIALQADGKIAAAGYSSLNDDSDLAVFQVTTNLNFDPGFHPAGNTNSNFAILANFPLNENTKPGNANVVRTQPDGKILVVGSTTISSSNQLDGAVARYLPNGDLDTSFAGGGLLTIDRDQKMDTAVDAMLQSDGKIVLALGRSYIAADTNNEPYLQRLLPDGTLDSGFGNAGRVSISFGQPLVPNSTAFKTVSRITQQADGKILVIGNILYFSNNTGDFELSRFNPDGTLDTAFGSGGTVSYAGLRYGKAVLVQGDGKIVTATSGLIFQRFLNNGTPDTTFGTNGVFTAAVGGQLYDLLFLLDGRILSVSLDANSQYLQLICLTSNGIPDAGFGNGGISTNNFGALFPIPSAAGLERDGKIIVCGQLQKQQWIYNYMIARFLTNGVPDNTFGANGVVTPSLGPLDTPFSAALQRDGRIVVIGLTGDNSTGYNNWSVLRFLNDQTNSPPTISPIPDQSILEDTSLAIPFSVSDWETPATELVVTAFSSNTNLLPASGLMLSGTDANRMLTLTPTTNSSGTATVTLQVNDGALSTPESFQLTVTAVNLPPALGHWLIGTNHLFSLQLDGESGKTYAIEASSDLTNWTQISTVTNFSGSLVINLEDVRTNSHRFFRARIP